jgi:hypothetical protein
MGGNGSVAIPPSVAPIVSSSIAAGIFAVFVKLQTRGNSDESELSKSKPSQNA